MFINVNNYFISFHLNNLQLIFFYVYLINIFFLFHINYHENKIQRMIKLNHPLVNHLILFKNLLVNKIIQKNFLLKHVTNFLIFILIINLHLNLLITFLFIQNIQIIYFIQFLDLNIVKVSYQFH